MLEGLPVSEEHQRITRGTHVMYAKCESVCWLPLRLYQVGPTGLVIPDILITAIMKFF